ncbi:uncharacterized protein LOC133804342 [Humulus lupulus]|uniref:uncharacterized protein LOC133804342 n=1 Tax=Humulus lupulus TaxID=3486 RepID=UPI002B4100E4|nr:uncharacterized protein LOC133804342 [Humulus lupulus]
MASDGPSDIPPRAEFIDLSSDSESPEGNPHQDYDSLRQARIRHLECMADLRRKIWVVESEIDSVSRGDEGPSPLGLSDHIARLRTTLFELRWELEFMEGHIPPEPPTPSSPDDSHGVANSSPQPLVSVYPSLVLPPSLPRWKTLARKKKWRVKCSAPSSHISFDFADMSKARRQVSAQEEDDAPLLASSLVSHVSPNKLKAIVKHYRAPPEYALHVPQEACWADRPEKGFVALSEQILKAGGTIPLHPFFVAVLNYFDLAPLQLSPNSWLTLSCLFIWFKDNVQRAPTAQEVHSLYNLMGVPKSKGFYYLQKANSELPLIEGSFSNTGPWKQDFFWVEEPLSVREGFRAGPRKFADPSVIGPEAEAIGKLLAADSALKKAAVLFTVVNLNRHQLSPVSNPKFLWSVTGSKKAMAMPAGPSLHDGGAEEETEDVPLECGGSHQRPLSPGGCPPYGSHDQDMACQSPDPQAAGGCYAPSGLDGNDAFPQVPHDIGLPDADYIDLAEPPSNARGFQFFPFPAPPPASASGSSVPVQPDVPSAEAEPWVTRMASAYGQHFVQIASGLPASD